MSSIGDLGDILNAINKAELEAMREHASTLPYSRLADAASTTTEALRESEQELERLRDKLSTNKRDIAGREAQLAFTPTIEVEGDSPRKRMLAEQDRLSTAYRHTREGSERKRLMLKVAQEEIQRRATKLSALVTERVYAEWQKQAPEVALTAAREAVVAAMLAYCGHRTQQPAFEDAQMFMAQTLNFRLIQRMTSKAEEDERQRQAKLIIEQDNQLG